MSDSIFRIILIPVFFIFALVWIKSFVISGIKKSALFASAEGIITGLLMRIFLTVSIWGIIIYIIKPIWMEWSSLGLPLWIRFTGLPLSVLAIYLLYWALHYLGHRFSASLILKEDHILITTGPYRWLQHPMYVSFVLIWIAFFLISANWFIGLTGIVAYAIIIIFRIPQEEKMMFDRFGEQYIAYQQRTGRFIPKI